ncbi:MAG: phosphate transport system regulatory protein PhoU [Actinobacteria bacterium]|nr:phosphate transport system regulatory protein PhoU [Actinomycetota bacterium]
MRSVFQDELDNVSQSLVDLTTMVSTSVVKASKALQTADLNLAEEVIATDNKIDDYQHDLDARIIDIIARQQPVASDLRALVTALRMSADLERMGDLSHHIAKVARLRHPNSAIPNDLLLAFTEMGHVAEKLATKVATVITTRDTDMALQVEKDDDEMDELHKKVIAGIIGSNPVLSLDVAIDLTLLGRYYERFADHAVSVARRVYFLVKGEFAS